MILGKKLISFLVVLVLVLTLFPILTIQLSSDLSDPLALTVHSPIFIIGNSQFNLTNGVVSGMGTKTKPYIIENWEINASANYGICIKNTNAYFIIRNCYIYKGKNIADNKTGVYFENVKNGLIINNRIEEYKHGIFLEKSRNNAISNNTCFNNTYNIYLNNSNSNEIIYNNCSTGFDFQGHVHVYSIYLDISDFNIIKMNFCSGYNAAIYIEPNSDYNLIDNNSFIANPNIGILNLGSNTTIINNTFRSNNYMDIALTECSNLKIINNYFSGTGKWCTCIKGDNTHNNLIKNNTFLNSYEAIRLYKAYYNQILNNTFMGNKAGILVYRDSSFNTIYNNYFNNSYNYDVYEGHKNTWNIPKTPGRNIIGGPLIGGNFWSNYTGKDTNNDGFGDTNLPYGDGDYLPLVPWSDQTPPEIIDNTESNPTTGDTFYFNFKVFDVGQISDVHLEYWFDNGTPLNVTPNKTHGTNIDADYSFNISVPDYAFKLFYFIGAGDLVLHWTQTMLKTLNVIDNDAPTIVDNTSAAPTTGDNFSFAFIVEDNIDVANVSLGYWYNYGSYQSLLLGSPDEYYNSTITVPSDAKKLHYNASVIDTSGTQV